MPDDFNLLKLLEQLSLANTELTNKRICSFTEKDHEEFCRLLYELDRVHITKENTYIKGKALEDLVVHLLRASGDIFVVQKNIRTHTNEIDQVIELTQKGKLLLRTGILPYIYNGVFISECKNYKSKVSVTYVGKFCHLLTQCEVRLGLLFSYSGITGTGWNSSSGLIRKFYLSKENIESRTCVIPFSIDDFRCIEKGESNLLDIIERKMKALQLDCDYMRYMKPHPAEAKS